MFNSRGDVARAFEHSYKNFSSNELTETSFTNHSYYFKRKQHTAKATPMLATSSTATASSTETLLVDSSNELKADVSSPGDGKCMFMQSFYYVFSNNCELRRYNQSSR